MKLVLVFFSGLLLSLSVSANDDVKQRITQSLSRLIPDVEVHSVQKSPVDGLYQVLIGADVLYMTEDGNFVFKGELLDMEGRRNVTEDVRTIARKELINGIAKTEYIEFASNEPKDAIYVFTDVDCGYCRKLHQDVPELNSRGVSVRYLAYPRAGVGSNTAKEMESVWCAADRNKAMDAAKNREPVKVASCDNPIAKQYELGQQLGVRGTPAIYLPNGQALPGYMPPDELIRRMRN